MLTFTQSLGLVYQSVNVLQAKSNGKFKTDVWVDLFFFVVLGMLINVSQPTSIFIAQIFDS